MNFGLTMQGLLGLVAVLAFGALVGGGFVLLVMRVTEGHWLPRRDCNCQPFRVRPLTIGNREQVLRQIERDFDESYRAGVRRGLAR